MEWPPGNCHVMRSISQQSHLINGNIISFVASPQNKLDVHYNSSNSTSYQNHHRLDQSLTGTIRLLPLALEKVHEIIFYSVSTPRRLVFVFFTEV